MKPPDLADDIMIVFIVHINVFIIGPAPHSLVGQIRDKSSFRYKPEMQGNGRTVFDDAAVLRVHYAVIGFKHGR